MSPSPSRFPRFWLVCWASLRHHEQSDEALFTIGPYCFRPSAKFLLDEARNKKVRLTEKETTILKFLYQTGGRMVKRDALLNEVWGYNASVTTHTLETHVYRLRQKIEIDPSNAQILVTEPGGYRLVLDVARGQRLPAPALVFPRSCPSGRFGVSKYRALNGGMVGVASLGSFFWI